MLVGIRPTIGRISRYGVIPITADHDTAGPMTRTVTDAAIMLGALESPSPDPNDPATTTLHAAAGPRLHEVPERRRTEGRAHRDSARVLLRPHHADRRSAGPRRRHQHDDDDHGGTRRPERGAGQGDGRRDRGAEAAQARSSSIRPTCRASRRRIRRTTSPRGTSAPAPIRRRARTKAARSTSSTA